MKPDDVRCFYFRSSAIFGYSTGKRKKKPSQEENRLFVARSGGIRANCPTEMSLTRDLSRRGAK